MDDICLSVSATTRNQGVMRSTAKIIFVDLKEFQEMIDNNKLLEWTGIFQWYGTPRHFVLEHLQKGCDVLLEIDIQGAMQVKKMPEAIFIFSRI